VPPGKTNDAAYKANSYKANGDGRVVGHLQERHYALALTIGSLDVSPPRERPMQRLRPLFFDVRRVLMDAHDRTVDHLNLPVVGL